MANNIFGFTSETTFQKLINNKKFWKDFSGKLIKYTTAVSGSAAFLTSLLPSVPSIKSFLSPQSIIEKALDTAISAVKGTVGLGTIIAGQVIGYFTDKESDKEIKKLEELKNLTDVKDLYFATSEIPGTSETKSNDGEVSTHFINTGIINGFGIDLSTKKFLEGQNVQIISNRFNLEELITVGKTHDDKILYNETGKKQIDRDIANLMMQTYTTDKGDTLLTRKIVEDRPITLEDIYNAFKEKYGPISKDIYINGEKFKNSSFVEIATIVIELKSLSKDEFVNEQLKHTVLYWKLQFRYFAKSEEINIEKSKFISEAEDLYTKLEKINDEHLYLVEKIHAAKRHLPSDSGSSEINNESDTLSSLDILSTENFEFDTEILGNHSKLSEFFDIVKSIL